MGRNLPLILAVIVGVIAAGLTYSYLKSQQQLTQQLKAVVIKQREEMKRLHGQLQQLSRQTRVREKVPVVVAKRDLRAGEILTSEMVEEKYIPREAKIPAAAGSVDAVIGKQLIADVVKGEQIILSRLVSPEVLRKQVIPPGRRLVTVEVEQTDLFRFIRPGDKVDVAVVLTLPGPYVVSAGLFSDVEIKAINGRISYDVVRNKNNTIQRRGQEEQVIRLNPHKGTITFALPLKEAAILKMASRFGKIEIYPRSRIDPLREKVPPVTLDTVLQYVLPELVSKMNLQKQETKKEGGFVTQPVKRVKRIKIRRGSQVEVKEILYDEYGATTKMPAEEEISAEEQSESLIEQGNPLEETPEQRSERRGMSANSRKLKEDGDEEDGGDPFKDRVPPSLDKYLTRGLGV